MNEIGLYNVAEGQGEKLLKTRARSDYTMKFSSRSYARRFTDDCVDFSVQIFLRAVHLRPAGFVVLQRF